MTYEHPADDADQIPDDDPQLADLIDAVNEAEGELIEAQEQRAKVRAALAEHLLARGERSVVGLNHEGERFAVQVVSRDTTKIDADALLAKIGVRKFNKLTERKLVTAKVKEAVDSGLLDVATLAEVTEVSTGTSIRVQRVDA